MKEFRTPEIGLWLAGRAELEVNRDLWAVDFDDCMVDYVGGFCDVSNQQGWTDGLSRDGFKEDWFGLWGLDPRTDAGQKEFARRMSVVYKSEAYWEVNPVEGAVEAIGQISEHDQVVVLTSRALIGKGAAIHSIETHFPGLVEGIAFTGFYDGDASKGINLSKGAFLPELGAIGLVDDHAKHANSAVEVGRLGIKFGDHPWDSRTELLPGVANIETWPGVVEYVNEQRASRDDS